LPVFVNVEDRLAPVAARRYVIERAFELQV
jgi:hypothetical protein